ncbi:hypothetical protein LGH82_17615 [Mesorhizobium sp. PAMC28654]|uniref:hypothetical protein n=1 Tax=Mesorhizobium sp. PAMC28654 TaxID=2880934 RepID=UPI001D0BB588|nr:hypothetical protein [Mesorhizobium sp. PAMC28654]UDL87036.1 hypothetical protein LGH82_17615 [Mesorhizobium sp. PAMC28654]
MTKQDLDTRIADAFATAQTSGYLSDLIDEAASAETKARDEFAFSKQAALDPATRADDLSTARKGMAEAEFSIARLQAATTKLKALLKTTQTSEQQQRPG